MNVTVLQRGSYWIHINSVFQSSDNQDGSDWRDDDEKLPGHENLTEKDIELFRRIQELALQVYTPGETYKAFLVFSGCGGVEVRLD